MQSMFDGCESLSSINLANFNTSKVTALNHMFYNCKNLTTLDLTSFKTGNIESMDCMFAGCKNLKTIYVSSSGWKLTKAEANKDNDGRNGTWGMFGLYSDGNVCHAKVIER